MDDYGIKISVKGTDVSGASISQLLMNSRFPFEKLDTTKAVSFETIYFTFNNNTPTPTAGNSNTTQIYSFAHGYSYIPKIWALIYDVNADTYYQGSSFIKGSIGLDYASLYLTADTTNIYFNLFKANGSGGTPNVAGQQYQIRLYVFVDNMI